MRGPLVLSLIGVLAACGVHAARSAREHMMSEPLRVSLSLEQSEIIRGESAYFTVVVENVSAAPLEEAITLGMHGEPLRLEAVAADASFSVTEKEMRGREAVYAHGPRNPPTTTIPPRGKLQRRDDLLTWFGELPPGTYKVTATYTGAGEGVTSEAVALKVLPADPVALDAARAGGRLGSAQLGAAWVHRVPAAAGGGNLVFYQQQSQNLPRSPVHGLRVAKVAEVVKPLAATTAGPAVENGWVVWGDGRQRLMAAKASILKPAPMDPMQIKTPFAGTPLASPLALGNGGLLIPFADASRGKAAVITLGADGAVGAVDVPLAAGAPMGPAVWLWALELRLDAAWAKAGGREILWSRLPIDDLAAGFTTPQTIAVDDPVIWLDGYYDEDGARARHVGEGEAPPPDVVLWAVLRRAKSVGLARVNLAIRRVSVEWSPATGDDTPLEPLSSVVTKLGDLAMLFLSPRGRVMYAGTAAKRYCPLQEAAGVEITPAQSPTLMAAGVDGARAWVYVRYIDKAKNRIAYVKLEPVGERDPMEPAPAPEPKRGNADDWPDVKTEGGGG